MPITDADIVERRDSAAVERLLRALPDWFGIEESLANYVADAARKQTYLAVHSASERVLGALLVTRHFPGSAEIHLLAVDPRHHRQGIGTALVRRFEDDMRADGAHILEVKTQGPSLPDENYAATLAFYVALGFEPLEEVHGYWGEIPCLILVKAAG
jgi:ribosomal protein S18 acetylase RimI-like enzyme